MILSVPLVREKIDDDKVLAHVLEAGTMETLACRGVWGEVSAFPVQGKGNVERSFVTQLKEIQWPTAAGP